MKMLLRTSAVLDGRWTFQIVDEFNDLYYQPAISLVRKLKAIHLDGQRHLSTPHERGASHPRQARS